MQIHLLLISILSIIGAKSLPSLSTTPSTLDKRDSYGWIASFDAEDASCANETPGRPHAGNLHKLKINDCHKWNNLSPRVGLDWGAGSLSFMTLAFYTKPDCNATSSYVGNQTDNNYKAGFCFQISDFCPGSSAAGGPCSIQSVYPSDAIS